MITHKDLEDQLITAYSEINKTVTPEYAVRQRNCPEKLVLPTIPFIGKHYVEQKKKILVYASAESLADYYPDCENPRPWLDNPDQAVNRHRVRFDSPENDVRFFPDIHIQPIYDGTLATAVLYLALSKALYLSENENITPKQFYENIAIANYSKYTYATERQKNIYAGKGNRGQDINIDPTNMPIQQARSWLAYSHPYLEKDIEILQPDIVILPEGIDNRDKNYLHFAAKGKDVEFIGIYQLGPTPINCVIPSIYPSKNIDAFPILKEWVSHIERVSKDKFLHVFTYLDSKI